MLDAFTGLDRYIPRQVRGDLIGWQKDGLVTIRQVSIPDEPHAADLLDSPNLRWAVDSRWQADSPLRRAALAGLAYMHGLGADLDDVELAGRRLPTAMRLARPGAEAQWWINWKWNGYSAIPYSVPRGRAWLEVVQPTRTRALVGLLIEPAR
jgi:hypothetical protein